MKIGLLPVDSRHPNLALMKLSAWHKAKGDGIVSDNGDIVTAYYYLLPDENPDFFDWENNVEFIIN